MQYELLVSLAMRILIILFTLTLLSTPQFGAEVVTVTVSPDVERSIGGVSEFSRKQFVTVHESFGSTDMDNADARFLNEELEVSYGRDGGLISWQAGQTSADPSNGEMPDLQQIKEMALEYRKQYAGERMNGEFTREVVLCTHPELMHPMPENDHAEWGPRSNEAIAEYTAQMLKHYWNDDDRPIYLEVLNEPFVKAKKIGTTVDALSEQHNVVAERVRELNPNVQVGGYAAAWVEVEARNFEHWNNWQKRFMDIAGENMDFFSYHIYDGVNVMGEGRNRTGSNSEALMDLIDSYSFIKFGVAKPQMITEFGKIPEGNMGNMTYSSKRSAEMLYSFNGQLMTFMDHPDRLLKVVPFILGKAMWTYKPDREGDDANPFLLWRMKADGSFVETELSMFYKYWKGVEGEWRASSSSNPDVRVHLLADGDRLLLALTNLDDSAKTIQLDGLKKVKVFKVSLRTLETHGEEPSLAESELKGIPSQLELAAGQSSLLILDTKKKVKARRKIVENRVYATEYLKDIVANEPLNFEFLDTPTGEGTVCVRLSPGRTNEKAVLPSSIKLNGHPLEIASNWAGDDQAGRSNFFGMIEFAAPIEYLKPRNTVEVVYPDSGGKVACVVLQVNLAE